MAQHISMPESPKQVKLSGKWIETNFLLNSTLSFEKCQIPVYIEPRAPIQYKDVILPV